MGFALPGVLNAVFEATDQHLAEIEEQEAAAAKAQAEADAAKAKADADAKIAALPKIEVPEPDYKGLWNAYSGWLDNINQRNIGQLADVRARLSAAGASPDILKMQTEHLESQRKKDILSIQDTETYRTLQKGLDTGKDRVAGDTLDTYYTRKFGAYQTAPASAASVSMDTARNTAGGGANAMAAGGGTSSGSPWFDESDSQLL